VTLDGHSITTAGGSDVFLAKLDASGAYLWGSSFGDFDEQRGVSVAVDVFGNIVVAGMFASSIDFGGGSMVSAGGMDAFVAKFDPGGNYLWSKSMGDMVDQRAIGVATDSSGNILLTGDFMGTLTFTKTVSLLSLGSTDVFVAKLGP